MRAHRQTFTIYYDEELPAALDTVRNTVDIIMDCLDSVHDDLPVGYYVSTGEAYAINEPVLDESQAPCLEHRVWECEECEECELS